MKLFDAVPREQYEELKAQLAQANARYDMLFAAYEKLRPTHAPASPMRLVPPKEEPGLATLHAAEAAVSNPRVAVIADNLIKQDPTLRREVALREAKRLDDIARGRAVAPSAATPPEPPSR